MRRPAGGALALITLAAASSELERELRSTAVLVGRVVEVATSTIGRDGATLAGADAAEAAWLDRIVVFDLEVDAVELWRVAAAPSPREAAGASDPPGERVTLAFWHALRRPPEGLAVRAGGGGPRGGQRAPPTLEVGARARAWATDRAAGGWWRERAHADAADGLHAAEISDPLLARATGETAALWLVEPDGLALLGDAAPAAEL